MSSALNVTGRFIFRPKVYKLNNPIICQTRCLSLTCVKTKDTSLVPGDIKSFIRIFGFKTDNSAVRAGNVAISQRRRLRRALASFLFTPFYILPVFFNEITTPYGGLDIVSVTMFLLAIQCYSASIIRDDKPCFPIVHRVLFNPYTGGVVLMREQWKNVINPLKMRKPVLEAFYIKPDEIVDYKPIGTTLPEGIVLRKSHETYTDGEEVPHHEGFVHSNLILNEIGFDNYANELLENKLMNEMISIRFQKDRVYRLPDVKYGLYADFVENSQEDQDLYQAKKARKEFKDRMHHPTFQEEMMKPIEK